MAKAALAATGTMIFAAALGLARVSFAGHPKNPTSLTAPDAFVSVVHDDLLAAGIIGPTDAPADVVTSVS
jgi:hypothetical protein